MEKNNKIACSIIAGILIFGFIVNIIPNYINNDQGDKIERIILFSLDSCNPEYLGPDYMPKMYNLLIEEGIIYKNGWAPMSAETMNGHTTMLTGCWSNSTGIIGNGFHDSTLPEDEQPENPVQDPKYRLVDTIFENLKKEHENKGIETGFVSGKWRLPDFLAQDVDYVFASPVCKEFDICPKGYEALVGQPMTYGDGDNYDQWIMRAMTELVKKDDPDFIFCNLAWTDVAGHDTASFNLNIRRQLQMVDDLLWQFTIDLKAMGKFKSTLFIFVSDHGMNTITDVFDAKGYLEGNGIKVDYLHAEGQTGYVFLNDKGDTKKTVELLEKNDKVALVLPRDEMYKLHLDTYEKRTGQVFFSCKEHVMVAIPGLMGAQIGTHGGISARDVLFAIMGPQVKKGGFIQESTPGLEDIVPTIYDIWDLTKPNYMNGRSIWHDIKE